MQFDKLPGSDPKKDLLIFLFLYIFILALFGINRPCWRDECHFVETVRLFITHPTLSTLRHYHETSTPLPFIIYALWGAIIGDSLTSLRIASLIIAFITYCSFYHLFTVLLLRPRIALLFTFFIALHPYMLGASIFVFTDMLSMLFLAILLIAMKKGFPIFAFTASACGLLCRQYFIFVSFAAIIYCLWCFYVRKNRRDLFTATALIASTIPLIALFALWNGFCPINEEIYTTKGLFFHPNAVTLYLIQIFVYMLPLIFPYWKALYHSRLKLILSLSLCWMYWLFPVVPSEPAKAAKILTVGYLHRGLQIWPGEQFEHWIFFICFACALPIVMTFLSDIYLRFKNRSNDFALFMNLSILSFLIIMPFSYVYWEKYFLPLMPIIAIQLAAFARPYQEQA